MLRFLKCKYYFFFLQNHKMTTKRYFLFSALFFALFCFVRPYPRLLILALYSGSTPDWLETPYMGYWRVNLDLPLVNQVPYPLCPPNQYICKFIETGSICIISLHIYIIYQYHFFIYFREIFYSGLTNNPIESQHY